MRKQYDFSKGRRGPVLPVPTGKTKVTLPLDDDILDWFREQVNATGGGHYPSLINAALRAYVSEETPSLEDVVRRVVREELRRAQGR